MTWQWRSVIGIPSVSLSAPDVTWQWLSVIGVPSVSLSVPIGVCSVLVGFPLWLAMFVGPACRLACFEAGRSAGTYGCMCIHSHVHSLFMPLSVWWVLFLLCFASPPFLPRFPSFCFFFFFTDLFSVTVALGCWHGGRGLVARVQVGKATGVVYLPGLGSLCLVREGRALGTQPPLMTSVVSKWQADQLFAKTEG